MQLNILTEASSISLVVAAMSGGATAKLVLAAADRLLRQIQRRSRARALPCVLCDDGAMWRNEPPCAIAVLLPFGLQPVRTAVGMAVCSDCVAACSERQLAQTVVSKLRATLMPDLRVVPAPSAAGHA